MIFLWDEKAACSSIMNVTIGRQELLSCLYSACGCDVNIYSTKNKCPECQQVNEWAPYALSRRMLHFSSGAVQGRGRHASILVDSKVLDTPEKEEEWSDSTTINTGTKISLIPFNGPGILEFELVSLDRKTKAILDSEPTNLAAKSTDHTQMSSNAGNEDVATDWSSPLEPHESSPSCDAVASVRASTARPITSDYAELPVALSPLAAESSRREIRGKSESSVAFISAITSGQVGSMRERCMNSTYSFENEDDASCSALGETTVGPVVLKDPQREDPKLASEINRKSTVRTIASDVISDSQEFILYFCPLGQDLPHIRRRMLAKKAKQLGAKVMNDFHLATHVIVSEFVTSLSQVSKQIGVPEDELSGRIDQVSHSTFGH
jgi:hypothetical protein